VTNDPHLFLVRKNAEPLQIEDPAKREVATMLIASMLSCVGKMANEELRGFLVILMEPEEEANSGAHRLHLVRLREHINDLIEAHDTRR
jgi:hypothetical protein